MLTEVPPVADVSNFSVEVEHRFDTIRLVLSGELDISTVSVLIDAFGAVRPEAPVTVVVDLAALDVLSACGINAIILAAGRLALKGCWLGIAGARPIARRCLIATGLASLLIRTPSRAEMAGAPRTPGAGQRGGATRTG